ncbi:XdhC family protein [Puia dinghuensis]|uniref:XdhC/CoxI family protein n=1 Tax=Puia dinghuensis TaxID=1792502 RepID=A0A8J2UCQ6_9BACT|nr:XdhC family protein [Puia dinghuensis]GGA99112.1 XdhC/CoxI family protein [Puia dinghuensis]
MKEIRSIVVAWQTLDLTRTKAALATVVRVEGSSYRRAGARMLVLDDGTYLGGISGGCLEGDALRRAQKGIALQRPSVITYDTTQDDDYQVGVGLGCQGIIDVLFTPLQPDDATNPLSILASLTDIRQPAALITVTGSPDPLLLGRTFLFNEQTAFHEQSALPKDLPQADIQAALTDRTSRSITSGDTRFFIEIILPAIHIVAYGGNYDIRTLLQQTKELGWDSTVILNTTRADKALVKAATTIIDSKSDQSPLIDGYTAVLLMSHDYNNDKRNLQRVLSSAASYIGILGPRKRAEKLFTELSISEEDQRRIYAPAGLDIGAANPEEIALSILAEVRSHFSRREGMSLRRREGSIYG